MVEKRGQVVIRIKLIDGSYHDVEMESPNKILDWMQLQQSNRPMFLEAENGTLVNVQHAISVHEDWPPLSQFERTWFGNGRHP